MILCVVVSLGGVVIVYERKVKLLFGKISGFNHSRFILNIIISLSSRID